MTLRNNMVEEQKLLYLAQLELMQQSVRQMDSASLKNHVLKFWQELQDSVKYVTHRHFSWTTMKGVLES